MIFFFISAHSLQKVTTTKTQESKKIAPDIMIIPIAIASILFQFLGVFNPIPTRLCHVI